LKPPRLARAACQGGLNIGLYPPSQSPQLPLVPNSKERAVKVSAALRKHCCNFFLDGFI
jgi:hypothetical protein